MTSPRFLSLLRLRFQLVRARVAAASPWQRLLFLLALSTSTLFATWGVPILGQAFGGLDDGLLVAVTCLTLALLSVFGVHLLLDPPGESLGRRSFDDPMDLLPVPAPWSFLLAVFEEAFTEPTAWLTFCPLLFGLAATSPSPLLASVAVGGCLPLVLALVAAFRLTLARLAVALFPPSRCRTMARGMVYGSLILVVFVGGALVHDLFVLGQRVRDALEALDLLSSPLAYRLLDLHRAWPRLFESLPPTWLARCLTGPSSVAGLAFFLFAVLILGGLARFHRWLLARPAYEESEIRPSRQGLEWTSRLWRICPLVSPEMLRFEFEAARARGAFSEAVLQGTLLLGAMLLLVFMQPSLYGSSFVRAHRLMIGLATLFLVTPAAATVRSGGDLSQILALPLRRGEILVAPLLPVLMRNLLVLAPWALVLPFLVPRAEGVVVVGAALHLALVAVVSTLAAVGAGWMLHPMKRGRRGFAPQILAIGMAFFALGPLAIAAPALDGYRASGLLVLSLLFVGGLWQKAWARIEGLALPGPERAPSALLGDAMLAVLLFANAATFVAPFLRRLFVSLDPDDVEILATACLHLATAFGIWSYGRSSSRAALPGPSLGWRGTLLPVLAGILLAVAVMGVAPLWTDPSDAQLERGPGVIVRSVSRASPPRMLLALLVASVLAPVAEELLFRRMLFRGLVDLPLGPWRAALLSALAFAFVHEASAFPFVFLVGLGAAAFQDRWGRTLPAMLFHGAFNGTQLSTLLLQRKALALVVGLAASGGGGGGGIDSASFDEDMRRAMATGRPWTVQRLLVRRPEGVRADWGHAVLALHRRRWEEALSHARRGLARGAGVELRLRLDLQALAVAAALRGGKVEAATARMLRGGEGSEPEAVNPWLAFAGARPSFSPRRQRLLAEARRLDPRGEETRAESLCDAVRHGDDEAMISSFLAWNRSVAPGRAGVLPGAVDPVLKARPNGLEELSPGDPPSRACLWWEGALHAWDQGWEIEAEACARRAAQEAATDRESLRGQLRYLLARSRGLEALALLEGSGHGIPEAEAAAVLLAAGRVREASARLGPEGKGEGPSRRLLRCRIALARHRPLDCLRRLEGLRRSWGCSEPWALLLLAARGARDGERYEEARHGLGHVLSLWGWQGLDPAMRGRVVQALGSMPLHVAREPRLEAIPLRDLDPAMLFSALSLRVLADRAALEGQTKRALDLLDLAETRAARSLPTGYEGGPIPFRLRPWIFALRPEISALLAAARARILLAVDRPADASAAVARARPSLSATFPGLWLYRATAAGLQRDRQGLLASACCGAAFVGRRRQPWGELLRLCRLSGAEEPLRRLALQSLRYDHRSDPPGPALLLMALGGLHAPKIPSRNVPEHAFPDASLALGRQDWKSARILLEGLSREGEWKGVALEALADLHLRRARPDEAGRVLDRLEELEGETLAVLVARGKVDLARGKVEEALGRSRRAVALCPISGRALALEGKSLAGLGREEEGRATLRRAEALWPEGGRAFGCLLPIERAARDETVRSRPSQTLPPLLSMGLVLLALAVLPLLALRFLPTGRHSTCDEE